MEFQENRKSDRIRTRAVIMFLLLLFGLFSIRPGRVYAATETERRAFDFLAENSGMNSAQICGLMAVLDGRTGFNVNYHGEDGQYGVAAYGTESSVRSFCKEYGLSASSVEGQLAYFITKLRENLSTGLSYRSPYTQIFSFPNTAQGAYDAGAHISGKVLLEALFEDYGKPWRRAETARSRYWPQFGLSSLKATASSAPGKVTITWDTDAPWRFKIERAVSKSGPYEQLTPTAMRISSVTDTTGVRGKRYYYRVTACTSKGAEMVTSEPVTGICLPTLNDSKCKVTLEHTSMTYTGKPLKCGVKVVYGKTPLTEGKHFTVVYGKNINAGTAWVKVTGKGSFSGKVYKSFKIKKATQPVKKKNLAVWYSQKPIDLSGYAPGTVTAVSSDPSVAKVSGSKVIPQRSGYCYLTLSAAATSNYTAASGVKIRLRVYPSRVSEPKLTALKGGKVNVTWSAASRPGGYWVRYSRTPDFKSYKTIILGPSKGRSTQITGLPKGMVYVKVKAFKKGDGKYLFGKWSPVKSVRVK